MWRTKKYLILKMILLYMSYLKTPLKFCVFWGQMRYPVVRWLFPVRYLIDVPLSYLTSLINKPVNHSLSQSLGWSVSQTVLDQSVSLSVSLSTLSASVCQSVGQSASQPVNQSVNQPASYSVSHPANQSASQLASLSANQSASQPASQSIDYYCLVTALFSHICIKFSRVLKLRKVSPKHSARQEESTTPKSQKMCKETSRNNRSKKKETGENKGSSDNLKKSKAT